MSLPVSRKPASHDCTLTRAGAQWDECRKSENLEKLNFSRSRFQNVSFPDTRPPAVFHFGRRLKKTIQSQPEPGREAAQFVRNRQCRSAKPAPPMATPTGPSTCVLWLIASQTCDTTPIAAAQYPHDRGPAGISRVLHHIMQR